MPKEVWTRRAAPALFNQALTPLWYTLAGRWLKTEFWAPLAARQGWADLARVEPYRRQQSHLYTNSEFFRRLQDRHPGVADKVPPAWQPLETVGEGEAPAPPPGPRSLARRLGTGAHRAAPAPLAAAGPGSRTGLARPHEPGSPGRTAGPAGRRLVLSHGARRPGPSGRAGAAGLAAGRPGKGGAGSGAGRRRNGHRRQRPAPRRRSGARPAVRETGAKEQPARRAAVPGCGRRGGPPEAVAPLLAQWRHARDLRFLLGARLRALLLQLAAVLVQEKLLAHRDDVFFLYFDELWELWVERRIPAPPPARCSASARCATWRMPTPARRTGRWTASGSASAAVVGPARCCAAPAWCPAG
ncbi:hypothetical protein HML84_02810 [Alcanivorax sp. IO_7]|nr:hypothetical protein HML84_02810 [Alcanivorax sp. IO_7]